MLRLPLETAAARWALAWRRRAKPPSQSGAGFHLNELVRTTAFVLAMLYSVVFGVLTAGVFTLIYWTNTTFMDAQAAAKLANETQALLRVYRDQGLPALIDAVHTRSSMAGLLSHHYLLVDGALTPVAGNLPDWPEGVPAGGGAVEFTRAVQYPHTGGIDWDSDEHYEVAAQVTPLDSGHRLLIGYSLYESSELREQSLTGLMVGSIVTIVLALIVGAALGRSMLSRVDAIDSALADIMAGDLARRVEVTRRHDEFGQLAARINVMLDRVEQLVKSLKEVARNLSQDIRAPLHRVRAQLENLTERSPDPPARDSAERGLEDLDRISRALDDLLDVARSGAARLSIFENVDMSGLTEAAVERCRGRRAGMIGIRREVEPGLVVRGIPNLLSQVVDVLLEHAARDAGQGGHVEIGLSRAGNGNVDLVLAGRRAVGRGPEDRGAVGLREARSRSAPSELGLSAASAIAKLHGARLILEGHGTRRRIRLRFAG